MRAGKNEPTGASGESEVLAQFQRLGWAGVLDARQDVGTDLYLRPRDSRRYELGAVMGAQVKTGPSWFKEEKKIDGEVIGWWFRDSDREHIDYWLRHALPHVLILRDQTTDKSYWVHVTPEAVESTGKGAKILVPKRQTVDDAHREALANIALTQLPSPVWNGSAWTGAVNLSPVDEIRYALITPRLIAPHPNLAPESISAVEALAMQMLVRDELERILIPSPLALRSETKWRGLPLNKAREASNWCWRATAALHLWLYEDENSDLHTLREHAQGPDERAASAVLSCVGYFDDNDPDAALEVLNEALAEDDYGPVDYAWLQAQRARAMLEIGKPEDAFDLAMRTQRIYREFPSDVTASAIAGGCALTTFRATAWMQGDIGKMIQQSDNPTTWWRAQVLSYGFSAHLSEEFHAWAENKSARQRVSNRAHKRLLSAALLASCAADQDGWRHAKSMLGEHLLISRQDDAAPDEIAGRLTLLRLAGDAKAVKSATRRIVDEGPTAAATAAAREVVPARSTRTTASADLELLTAAGDVLDQAQADEVCAWALATLQDSQKYVYRTRPSFLANYKLIDLVKAIIWTVSDEALRRVIKYLLSLPAITDDGTAQTLARLVHAIPDHAWTKDERSRASLRTSEDARFLREAYLAVAAPAVPDSQQEIHKRACAGDLNILSAVNDIRALPREAVIALSEKAANAIDRLITDAEKGRFTVGALDPSHALALMSIWHPEHARWDCIEALLTSRKVRPEQQEGAIRVLAALGSKLTAPYKDRLAPLVDALRSRPPADGPFGRKDIRGLAAEALASLVTTERREELVNELLTMGTLQRASAALILERFTDPAYSDVLLALSGDHKPAVRDAAISGLSRLIAEGQAKMTVVDHLAEILKKSGRRTAFAIVSRLDRRDAGNPAISKLLSLGREHPSARVRRESTVTLFDSESQPASPAAR